MTANSGTSAGNPAVERLMAELQRFLGAQAERMLAGVTDKVGGLTTKLTDVAEGKGNPGGLLGGAAKELLGGASPKKALLKGGLKGGLKSAGGGLKNVAEKAKNLLGGGKSSTGGKSMNVVEDIDVGVPVHVAYNQWTSLSQFPKWSKGAQSVDVDDPVKSKWKAKVAWSNRNWNAKITEQIPDRRIAWTSDGPKGVVNGAVTFHPLGENLTKVLLVLEYIPSGFFEKTANLWRAQGRRARLDLKLFRKYVMTNPEAGQDGWRGEIRDSEVVREHDEVVAEEKKRAKQEEGQEEGKEEKGKAAEAAKRRGRTDDEEAKSREEEPPDDEEAEYDDEYDEYDEEPEEDEEDYDDEDEYDEEAEYDDYGDEEGDEEEEPEAEPEPTRRRAPATR